MKRSKRRGKKNKIANNQLGMAAIALVVLLLLGTLVVQSNDLQVKIDGLDLRAASLEEAIAEECARTEEIEELKEYMLTDEFASEVAREKLGLVKENEIVFEEAK